jgi:3',5'-cyclic AMP phosphodiesterase CpdA
VPKGMVTPLESRPAAPALRNTLRRPRRPLQRGMTISYQPPPCLAGGSAGVPLAEAVAWEEAFAGEAAGGVPFVSSQATNWARAPLPRIASKKAWTPSLFMAACQHIRTRAYSRAETHPRNCTAVEMEIKVVVGRLLKHVARHRDEASVDGPVPGCRPVGGESPPRVVALIVHLSDLHLTPGDPAQSIVFDQLVHTLRREREARNPDHVVVVITGDVFEAATQRHAKAVEGFLHLHARVVDALGGGAATVVVPGNHDRRRFGLLGPNRQALFQALHEAADPKKVYVAGCDAPFLAQVVPDSLHRLPFHVVAYDSTYLPGGLVGAGGTIRLEDLLMVHARLPDDGVPLLVLTHHHLIPTPLTDVSHIDSTRASGLTRWVVGNVLPALVSYGDREELTMTALGAGTALSTLHTLGRAVLLLHGHKHVPTARLVTGMTDGSGDLLIASAGSAGTRERVLAARHPDAARLWPSFSLVLLSEDELQIESLAFSPKQNTRPPIRRTLAHARRNGLKWKPEPLSFRASDPAPRVEVDEASYRLSPSTSSAERWDFDCQRRVERRPGARLRAYVEFVHALPRGLAARARGGKARRVELAIDGLTEYNVPDGLSRTLAEGVRGYGPGTAFEWVGLMCRYGAARATLRLARANAEGVKPFGSVTDLTIGREQPVRIAATTDEWTLTVESCAPRSLLRIYWPLSR